MTRLRLTPLLLVAAACGAPRAVEPAPEPVRPPHEAELARTLSRVLWLEDRRDDGGGELESFAASDDPEVRLAAVRALGRFPYPEHGARVSDALVRALRDERVEVRALAAFGLGLRLDLETCDALLGSLEDAAPEVRARAVEAASRFGPGRMHEELLHRLSDPSVLVRAEVALAPHRWDAQAPHRELVDSLLVNVAMRAPAALRAARFGVDEADLATIEPEDPEVIWRALFSLARRKAERGRPAFHLWIAAPQSVEARLFAAQGLASLAARDAQSLADLRAALADEDPRVAVEAARGLGKFPEAASLDPLARAAQRGSAQVRVVVAEALGYFKEHRANADAILQRLAGDESAGVRAEAVVARARLFGEEVAADLELRSLDPDARLRRAVARATEFLAPPTALAMLDRLASDAAPIVANEAVEAYGHFLAEGGRARTQRLLKSREGVDAGVKLAAVAALSNEPRAEDLEALLAAYSGAQGDLAGELETEVLGVAARVKDDRAHELLLLGARSPRRYTRTVARALFLERYPGEVLPAAGDPTPRRGEVPPARPDLANPLVEVRTERGTMVFELLADEAPVHVHNFVTLARRGVYDGLDFHRVVPDFVVQGGDPRGDGNGGRSWRGEPLRAELTPRKYVAGSLGMPRNADLDSGGGQFFVTHRRTPHLDGRYTLFGQLVQGAEVLQRVELGDRILSVTVRGAAE
ncbi:MAG: peptidylprolyl isomerase [Planctomycetes bacterium]|nr:peptidylprolyl isomerase [Planctomycetota bacterium]